jgi:phosphoribosylglycinamide formyltransferase
LAVFVSGGGSNFKAIHAAIVDGTFDAEVAAVVTNAPTCKGALYAQDHGIPVLVHPPPKANPSSGLTAEELTENLVNIHKADFIILAGYMKLVPAALVRAYHHAILNIHPGLLPSFGGKGFYGSRVHQAVIESGARFSGPTVHFVDEEYDTGPILAQAVVPVLPTDSADQLAARVLKEEHRLYPKCVAALCEGRITFRNDGIPIMWNAR